MGARLIVQRIWLLMWKNLILRKRHFLVTGFQILLPTVLILIFALLNWYASKEWAEYAASAGQPGEGGGHRGKNGPAHLTKQSKGYNPAHFYKLYHSVLAYTPPNDITNLVMKHVKEQFALNHQIIKIKSFPNEAAIERQAKYEVLPQHRPEEPTNKLNSFISAAIIFQFKANGSRVIYTLRLIQDESNTRQLLVASNEQPNQYSDDPYKELGFLALQQLVDHAFIKILTSHEDHTSLIHVKFEKSQSRASAGTNASVVGANPFLTPGLKFMLLSLVLPLAFLIIVPSVCTEVVSEKESGIKELMRIMGIPNWIHAVAWLIDSVIVLAIPITLMVCFLYIPFGGPPIEAWYASSDPLLGWVILFLYCMASVTMCMLISSFFENPSHAVTLALLLWIGTYIAFFIALSTSSSLSLGVLIPLCIIPNVGLLCWMLLTMTWEVPKSPFEKAVGSTWSNLFEAKSFKGFPKLTQGHVLLMMVLSVVVFLLFSMYVEKIMPHTHGVRQPWYFIIKECLFFNRKSKVGGKKWVNVNQVQREYFEDDPPGLQPGIEIRNLSKKYSNGKLAVDNLSITIFKGQITALLGHNGAGKTTMMSIITGLISPTSGEVFINGRNIRTDLEGARLNLGLCPQNNMLFDRLTVEEHMLFFAKLKGARRKDVNAELQYLVALLDLTGRKKSISKTLSGGQKRKLNLAMAMVGGSKVVILDEPTSGLDPESRRTAWDLLMRTRGQRTVLLSTHMMEEADVLGDRIAIMSAGRLKCFGSPMFLKNLFGSGYTLRMTITREADQNEILKTVQKHVSNASFKSTPNALEMAIVLPSLEDNATFPALFADLESQRSKLGIETVGLSLTTMDEIFVKVALMDIDIIPLDSQAPSKSVGLDRVKKSTSKVMKAADSSDHLLSNETDAIVTSEGAITESAHALQKSVDQVTDERDYQVTPVYHHKRSGIKFLVHQFYAIILKRFHYCRRKPTVLIIQAIIPLFMLIWVVVAVGKSYSLADDMDQPPLSFKLSSYNKPTTPYSYDTNDTEAVALGRYYAAVVGASAEDTNANGGDPEDYCKRQKEVYGRNLNCIVGANLRLRGSDENDTEWSTKLYSSTIAPHAAPLSLNLFSNALLNLYGAGNVSIETRTHPLKSLFWKKKKALKIANRDDEDASNNVVIQILLSLGLGITAAFLVVFPCKERLTMAKHLQLMTGVNVFIFWGATFSWDFLCLLTIIILMISSVAIFQSDSMFTENLDIVALLVILLVFAFSSISFAYLISFLVRTVSGGFSLIISLNICYVLLLETILDTVESKSYSDYIYIGYYIGRITPFYGIARSLRIFAEVFMDNHRCAALWSLIPRKKLARGCATDTEGEFHTCCREFDKNVAKTHVTFYQLLK